MHGLPQPLGRSWTFYAALYFNLFMTHVKAAFDKPRKFWHFYSLTRCLNESGKPLGGVAHRPKGQNQTLNSLGFTSPATRFKPTPGPPTVRWSVDEQRIQKRLCEQSKVAQPRHSMDMYTDRKLKQSFEMMQQCKKQINHGQNKVSKKSRWNFLEFNWYFKPGGLEEIGSATRLYLKFYILLPIRKCPGKVSTLNADMACAMHIISIPHLGLLRPQLVSLQVITSLSA